MWGKKMTEQVLYETTVENQDGISGHVRTVTSEDLDVTVSSPLRAVPGTNPEQLLGAAFATCLNATIEAEERRRGLTHQSVVRVSVALARDVQGFQFHVKARVTIPHVPHGEAVAILAVAEQRCPVAKLLAGSDHVTVVLDA